MNIKKHKKEIKDYKNIKRKIAFAIGHIILEDMPKHNPMVHFFEVKKHLFKNRITVYIYCERPGLLIGKAGSSLNKLKDYISKDTNKKVSIVFFQFEPIIYPIIYSIYDIE